MAGLQLQGRGNRGGSSLATEIAGILTALDEDGIIDQGNTEFLKRLLHMLRTLLSEDLDNEYENYVSDDEDEALQLKAHLLANDDVLNDSKLFMSRRMRKMEQEYEHLTRFVATIPRKKARWTEDRVGLTRLEEMCELRPSKHAPGTIGVFAKHDIPVGTKLQYSGIIIDKETREEMLKRFVSTTDFEFSEKSAFAGYHLIGNPMRMAMQIIHTADQNLANCDIEPNKDAVNSGTIYSDVVAFIVPDKGLGDSDQQGILQGQELLTFYSENYFVPQPLSCDRCRLLENDMATTNKCEEPNCYNMRHLACFLSKAGEKSPGRDEPFRCEDHRDRSYNLYFFKHLNKLREQKRRIGRKARDTRSGPAHLATLYRNGLNGLPLPLPDSFYD